MAGDNNQRLNREIQQAFKKQKELKKIHADSWPVLQKQIDEFEKILESERLLSWYSYHRLLYDQLEGATKTAVDEGLCREPGMSKRDRAYSGAATEDDHKQFYLWMRNVMEYRINIVPTRPGKEARKAWEAVKISGKPSYKECQKFVDEIAKARIMMIEQQVMDQSPKALEDEMQDLYDKIPLGTPLRTWMCLTNQRVLIYDKFMALIKKWQSEQDQEHAHNRQSVAREHLGDLVEYDNLGNLNYNPRFISAVAHDGLSVADLPSISETQVAMDQMQNGST